jgi:predicted peptidase
MNQHLAAVVIVVGFAVPLVAEDRPAPGKQVALKFQSPTDRTQKYNYLLFLPNDYGKDDRKWPLIIFLHGGGESGEDVNLVKTHGPPKLVEERPGDFPFIVASPQAPKYEAPNIDRWDARLLSQFLDHLLAEFAADPDRVYLTGLSDGGFGTIRWAAREPKRFAAIVPICGGGWRYYGKHLKDVPIWMFHGDQDPGVPVRFAQELAEAIRAAGGDPKLTIYEGVGHDSWTATYNNPQLYQWLLSHKVSDRKRPENK